MPRDGYWIQQVSKGDLPISGSFHRNCRSPGHGGWHIPRFWWPGHRQLWGACPAHHNDYSNASEVSAVFSAWGPRQSMLLSKLRWPTQQGLRIIRWLELKRGISGQNERKMVTIYSNFRCFIIVNCIFFNIFFCYSLYKAKFLVQVHGACGSGKPWTTGEPPNVQMAGWLP